MNNIHNKINKVIFLIIFILSISLVFIYINNKNKLKEYSISLNYMNRYIDVKIYSNDYNKSNKALKEIDNIFNKHHTLNDKDNLYKDIDNTYLINQNLLNNKVDIDLDYVNIGFALKEVKEYLINNNFNRYIIDASGNKVLGLNYDKNNYNVGIEDPVSGTMKDVISLNNKSITTISIQDKIVKTTENNIKSVTVISNDEVLNNILGYILYLIPIDEGKEFIKNYDVEVIWFDNESNITTTNGYSKYKVIEQ